MGDNINIDWGAGASMNPEGPLGVVNQGYNGALKGYEIGQKRATINALQGVDLNDPQSIDASIGALVHANAGEQATALSNLSFTRSMRTQVPAAMATLQRVMAGPQSGQDAGGEAPTPSAADHAAETMGMAKDAADKLLATPEADRPAAFAQIKADMLKRGIPEQAIDAAGSDLSDAGLKSLSDHYGEVIAHGKASMGGQTAPTVAPHPSNAWYNNLTNSGEANLALSMMKAAGWDMTSLADNARALSLPEIQKQAEAQFAGSIAGSTKSAETKVEIEAGPIKALIDAFRAGKIKDAELPAAIRLAIAEQDAKAAHQLTDVHEVDANGNPTGRVTQERTDKVLQRAGKDGVVGRSQSPGEQSGQQADAGTFMENYKREANQSAIQTDLTARDQALAAAHMAQTLNPSNLTPWVAHNANTLNGLGFRVAAKDANNLAAYEQGLAQNLKNATTVFPKLTNEFHAVTAAVPTAKTPADAAALSLTTTAAIRDMGAREKQFRLQWAADNPGQYSERAFQEAWAKQPGANTSVFASPLFRDLKFNGKPVVVIDPHQANGRQWGYFMPFSDHPTPFKVR